MPAPPSITRTPPASCDRHPWVFDSQDDSQVREPSRTTADVSGLLAQVSILSGHQQMLADARTAVFKNVGSGPRERCRFSSPVAPPFVGPTAKIGVRDAGDERGLVSSAVFKTVCRALLRRPGWVRFPSIPARLAAVTANMTATAATVCDTGGR